MAQSTHSFILAELKRMLRDTELTPELRLQYIQELDRQVEKGRRKAKNLLR